MSEQAGNVGIDGKEKSLWDRGWRLVFGHNHSEELRAEYIHDFYHQLKSEYASFNRVDAGDAHAYDEFTTRMAALRPRLHSSVPFADRPTLAEMFEVEMLLLRAMSASAIRAKIWSTRSTYSKLVGEAIYAEYLASAPPDPKSAHDTAVREDLIDLTRGKHWWYLNAIVMEHGMRRYRKTLMRWMVGGLIVVLLFCLVLAIHGAALVGGENHATYGRAFNAIFLAVYAGILGAIISIARRVKQAADLPLSDTDPVIRLSTIINGDVGIQLSIMLGGAFALVLFFLFVAGLTDKVFAKELANQVFPHFQPCTDSGVCDTVPQTFSRLIPQNGIELGKLLVWCFIAGFAERLVPDMLDKLARGDKEKPPAVKSIDGK